MQIGVPTSVERPFLADCCLSRKAAIGHRQPLEGVYKLRAIQQL